MNPVFPSFFGEPPSKAKGIAEVARRFSIDPGLA
jgi:hypothetical protein